MEREKIFQSVSECLKEIITDGNLSISEKSDLFEKDCNDLGLDEINFINLIVSLEDKYCIELSDSELISCNTIADIVNIIESKLNC